MKAKDFERHVDDSSMVSWYHEVIHSALKIKEALDSPDFGLDTIATAAKILIDEIDDLSKIGIFEITKPQDARHQKNIDDLAVLAEATKYIHYDIFSRYAPPHLGGVKPYDSRQAVSKATSIAKTIIKRKPELCEEKDKPIKVHDLYISCLPFGFDNDDDLDIDQLKETTEEFHKKIAETTGQKSIMTFEEAMEWENWGLLSASKTELAYICLSKGYDISRDEERLTPMWFDVITVLVQYGIITQED